MATRRAGFTLIELLSVMAVMVMITTIVVASGFGMRRGAAYTAARQIPQNVLEYAHQRACMDGRKTAVLFAKSGENSDELVASIFQAAGTVSDNKSSQIIDRFSDVAEVSSSLNAPKVFNFSSGGSFAVKSIKRDNRSEVQNISFKDVSGMAVSADAAADGEKNKYYYPYTVITPKESKEFKSGEWPVGSAYGFEVADRQVLPKNYDYTRKGNGGDGGREPPFWFIFNPDGTSEKGSITIGVKESVGRKLALSDITFN